MNVEEILSSLGERFQGVDLSYRRSGACWPNKWRASLCTSKNERNNYRLEAFGDSAYMAVVNLLDKVNTQE